MHANNDDDDDHAILSCIVVLKRQNRLKVGTDNPMLKVETQSVSDDDVRKRLLEKPRFELAAKDWKDGISSSRVFQVFGPATGKARLSSVDRLTGGTRRQLAPVERSDRLPRRLRTGMSSPRYGGALP